MLREIIIGERNSRFQLNAIVKAFIISETIFWSAWNLITPILAVFATNNIKGGSVEKAASAVSVYLITRVIFELIVGKYLSTIGISKKFVITVFGMLIITLAFIGLVFTNNVWQFYLFYTIIGVGMGIAAPGKNSLFSTHLDKHKEASEWSIYDASVFIGMAFSAALGGFIAKIYGFPTLFLLAAILNFISTVPYLLYIKKKQAVKLIAKEYGIDNLVIKD